ncbi:MAG TPA: thioredoxin family protein [Chitinophagaceae bacterium]
MNKLLILLAAAFITVSAQASDSTTIQKAESVAATEHRYILLNFSGSDWCVPCIKMRKSIFESSVFKEFQSKKLVWVNADFPRSQKNLTKKQVKENEQLAEQYNKEGGFPFTLLLDEKGGVVKTWSGFPGVTAEQFINEINTAIEARSSTAPATGAQKSAETDGQPL